MKRLGVFLPRWNQLKTLLPVMQAAHRHGIAVHVICGSSPTKPALDPQPHVAAFRAKWPWAGWDLGSVVDSHYWAGLDAVIAQGVHGHEATLILGSGVPWVAVDHLGENTWARLCLGPQTWEPWHRVCISAPFKGDPEKAALTGYTAFDGEWPDLDEVRDRYGLPPRYILLGTAVVPDSLSRWMRMAYLKDGPAQWVGQALSGYRGPTYTEIVRHLRAVATTSGLGLVAKSRTKHPEHPANALADLHIGEEPTDPHAALHVVRASTFYTGLASGMALEAAVARIPAVNWMAYPQESVDHPGFHEFRQDYWIRGVWGDPGRSWLHRLYDDGAAWSIMRARTEHLASGRAATMHGSLALRAAGPWCGSSVRVLEAAGLL